MALRDFGSFAIEMAKVKAIEHIGKHEGDMRYHIWVEGIPTPFKYQYDERFAAKCDLFARDILRELREEVDEAKAAALLPTQSDDKDDEENDGIDMGAF